MKFTQTEIEGVYIIESDVIVDKRGSFIKTFNESEFLYNITGFTGLRYENGFTEHYQSINHPNVIRGMHYQCKPYAVKKLVHVSYGRIIDVVLDIRKNSKTYGYFLSFELIPGKSIFMDEGIAHGFYSLEESIVNYSCTDEYNKEHDKGILYNSFRCYWDLYNNNGFKSVKFNQIISDRDLSFKPFGEEDYGF